MFLQYLGSASMFHRDGWFHSLIGQRFQSGNEEGPVEKQQYLNIALVLLLPLFALSLLLFVVDDLLFGLPVLIVEVLIFLYALGRGNYKDSLRSYASSLKESEFESSLKKAEGVDQGLIIEEEQDISALHFRAIKGFAYQGFNRFFCVLFWFALLGPVAALAYRLIDILVKDYDVKTLFVFREVMEWACG